MEITSAEEHGLRITISAEDVTDDGDIGVQQTKIRSHIKTRLDVECDSIKRITVDLSGLTTVQTKHGAGTLLALYKIFSHIPTKDMQIISASEDVRSGIRKLSIDTLFTIEKTS